MGDGIEQQDALSSKMYGVYTLYRSAHVYIYVQVDTTNTSNLLAKQESLLTKVLAIPHDFSFLGCAGAKCENDLCTSSVAHAIIIGNTYSIYTK